MFISARDIYKITILISLAVYSQLYTNDHTINIIKNDKMLEIVQPNYINFTGDIFYTGTISYDELLTINKNNFDKYDYIYTYRYTFNVFVDKLYKIPKNINIMIKETQLVTKFTIINCLLCIVSNITLKDIILLIVNLTLEIIRLDYNKYVLYI